MRRKWIAGLAVLAATALTTAGPPTAQAVHADGPHPGPPVDGDGGHRNDDGDRTPQATQGRPGAAEGLGQLNGLLPRDKLTLESAIQVDLSNESLRLPLYPGRANGETVWFVLLDASDAGLAHDLGVNYAPKLANLAIGCPECVQTVTLDSPTPQENRFGPAVVNFQGAPDFSPTRIAEPGPNGFPLADFQPGAVAGEGYSPFIRIEGSNVVYNAPIVATGDGPFDVDTHTNTGDRVLGVHIAPPSPPGQFLESWVDMLFVKGFDAGQPIIYLSTDAGQPLTAVLERATFVPALNQAAYNGGDDFLGSARERLFGFINGQTGADNPEAQGFVHLAEDGHIAENASADNSGRGDGLRTRRRLVVGGRHPGGGRCRHARGASGTPPARRGAVVTAAGTPSSLADPTPTPVPDPRLRWWQPAGVANPVDPDPVTDLIGFGGPAAPTAARMIFDVLPDMFFLAAMVFAVGCYLIGVRRLVRNGHRWPIARTVNWLAGWALLTAVTNLGIARYAYVLFSAHMMQHMVLSMAVPIMLAGGAPLTLALRALRRPADPQVRGAREWLVIVIHSRVVRVLTHPLVALASYTTSLYGLYFSNLLGTLMRYHLGHLAMLTHFVLAGYLLFWVLIGIDPGRRRLSPPLLVIIHFAAMSFHAFFGIVLMQSSTLIAPDWYTSVHPAWAASPLSDQHLGAAIAWAFGEVPAAIVMLVLVRQWIRADEREQARLDRAADRAAASGEEDELARYNAFLQAAARDARTRGGDGG